MTGLLFSLNNIKISSSFSTVISLNEEDTTEKFNEIINTIESLGTDLQSNSFEKISQLFNNQSSIVTKIDQLLDESLSNSFNCDAINKIIDKTPEIILPLLYYCSAKLMASDANEKILQEMSTKYGSILFHIFKNIVNQKYGKLIETMQQLTQGDHYFFKVQKSLMNQLFIEMSNNLFEKNNDLLSLKSKFEINKITKKLAYMKDKANIYNLYQDGEFFLQKLPQLKKFTTEMQSVISNNKNITKLQDFENIRKNFNNLYKTIDSIFSAPFNNQSTAYLNQFEIADITENKLNYFFVGKKNNDPKKITWDGYVLNKVDSETNFFFDHIFHNRSSSSYSEIEGNIDNYKAAIKNIFNVKLDSNTTEKDLKTLIKDFLMSENLRKLFLKGTIKPQLQKIQNLKLQDEAIKTALKDIGNFSVNDILIDQIDNIQTTIKTLESLLQNYQRNAYDNLDCFNVELEKETRINNIEKAQSFIETSKKEIENLNFYVNNYGLFSNNLTKIEGFANSINNTTNPDVKKTVESNIKALLQDFITQYNAIRKFNSSSSLFNLDAVDSNLNSNRDKAYLLIQTYENLLTISPSPMPEPIPDPIINTKSNPDINVQVINPILDASTIQLQDQQKIEDIASASTIQTQDQIITENKPDIILKQNKKRLNNKKKDKTSSLMKKSILMAATGGFTYGGWKLIKNKQAEKDNQNLSAQKYNRKSDVNNYSPKK
jgi:hypothetical protein